MNLEISCAMLLKFGFIITIASMRMIVHFCQVFKSYVKELIKHFLKSLQYKISLTIKLLTLLLLKCISTIATCTQNIILKVCDLLARTTLNPNEYLLTGNYKTDEDINKSNIPKCNFINVNGNLKREHCFSNFKHPPIPDILIRNLQCNRSITLKIEPNIIGTDKQESISLFQDSYSDLLISNCSDKEVSHIGEVSQSFDKDDNSVLAETENRTPPAVESVIKSPDEFGMVSIKNIITDTHPTSAVNLDFKEDINHPYTFLENTNCPLKQSLWENLRLSNSSISEKQILVERKNLGEDFKSITMENTEKDGYNFLHKETSKKKVNENDLKLLRRHMLISDEDLSSNFFEKSESCDSIFEKFSTNSMEAIKGEYANNLELLNIENYANELNFLNYCQNDENSDSVLNTNFKKYLKADLECDFSKFGDENESIILEKEQTSLLLRSEDYTGENTVLKKQSTLGVKEFLPTETTINFSKVELTNQPISNTDDKIEVVRSNVDELTIGVEIERDLDLLSPKDLNLKDIISKDITQNDNTQNGIAPHCFLRNVEIERDLDLLSPKDLNLKDIISKDITQNDNTQNGIAPHCFLRNNEINNNRVIKVGDVKSLKTKTGKSFIREDETGEIISLTNEKTNKHRILPSKKQGTDFQMETLNNSSDSAHEHVGGLFSSKFSCLVCRNNLKNKFDVSKNLVNSDVIFPDKKNGKNTENNQTAVLNKVDALLMKRKDKLRELSNNGYSQDSNECRTNTSKTLRIEESSKFLKILQSLYPNEQFQLNTEMACKDNIRKSELIKMFYKNKQNDIDNKIFSMLKTFADLKSMSIMQYDVAMKQMFEKVNFPQNGDNMFESINLYLLGPNSPGIVIS